MNIIKRFKEKNKEFDRLFEKLMSVQEERRYIYDKKAKMLTNVERIILIEEFEKVEFEKAYSTTITKLKRINYENKGKRYRRLGDIRSINISEVQLVGNKYFKSIEYVEEVLVPGIEKEEHENALSELLRLDEIIEPLTEELMNFKIFNEVFKEIFKGKDRVRDEAE